MTEKPRVALYVTCLINSFRPQAAHACVSLLQSLEWQVEVPLQQTCCGQPAYNSGHRDQACAVAQHQISVLECYDAIVLPSGSCTGMIRIHYPTLFSTEDPWHQRAVNLAHKTYELSEFLQKQNWSCLPGNKPPSGWAYHTSCSCRRETKSAHITERLLQQKGVVTTDLAEAEVCCGFGGAFSTKFSDISCRMGTNKLDQIESSGADKVLSADFGCLMHLQGLASRQGRRISFHHLAEVLNMEF